MLSFFKTFNLIINSLATTYLNWGDGGGGDILKGFVHLNFGGPH